MKSIAIALIRHALASKLPLLLVFQRKMHLNKQVVVDDLLEKGAFLPLEGETLLAVSKLAS
jgi:hypothetical protein